MLFGAVTLQAWCFQALQQIACEKCGLTPDFFPANAFFISSISSLQPDTVLSCPAHPYGRVRDDNNPAQNRI
jgi:hypothetical protein